MGNSSGRRASPAQEGDPEKKGMYTKAKEGYKELVNAIIRPPRADYSEASLGPRKFTSRGRRFLRHDITLTNPRGLTLRCSHWLPEGQEGPIPCIVYLHGNSSCRLEALDCMQTLLAQGLSLFAFDFAGSGLSEGDYISLGWYERDDVGTVIAHLRESDSVSTIGLWGRSMGAATALMYAQRDPSLACLILDSPFASLPRLARELVESVQVQVPKVAVNIALRMIRSSVKKRAKFDINKIQPINYCETAFIPALFGAAEDDNFINPAHSKALHERYAGDKNLVSLRGNHNSKRERFFHTTVSIFLHETLIKPAGIKVDEGVAQDFAPTGFERFDMPSPLANRQTIVSETDVCLAKTGMVDEEDAMLQEAIKMSLLDLEEKNKSEN